ncbi:hypothetical protein IAU59_000436 [Kwoniella sp. CBS 9459]
MSVFVPEVPDTTSTFEGFQWPDLPLLEDEAVLNTSATDRASLLADTGTEGDKSPARIAPDILGFMGEGIAFHHLTNLIVKLYPSLTRDTALSIRKQVLSAPYLSAISKHYDLQAMCFPKANAASSNTIMNKHISLAGAVEAFEVYIGALSHYTKQSTPHTTDTDARLHATSSPGKYQQIDAKKTRDGDAGGPAAVADIQAASEPSKKRARQEGDAESSQLEPGQSVDSKRKVAGLDTFLNAIFGRIVAKLYQKSEEAHKPVSTIAKTADPKLEKFLEISDLASVAQGAKGELHLYLTNKKLPIPTYTSERVWPFHVNRTYLGRNQEGMVWETWYHLDVPQLGVIESHGMALNTKEASNIAAYRVLKELKKLE